MKEQLNMELKKIEGIPEDYKKHTSYLSRVIYEALGECVRSAQEGMAWLQNAAREMLENDLDVSWVTPLGLHATQDYQRFHTRDLTFRYGKQRIRLTQVEALHEQDRRKNQSAFAPNFIHSLDASHLGFTVLSMADNYGIRDFSMVHDSFGTTLDNVSTMNRVLREEFVRLYTEYSPLEDLRKSFSERTGGIQLSPAPKMGALDLTQVLKSQYFFM